MWGWVRQLCHEERGILNEATVMQGVQFGAPRPSPAHTPIEKLAGSVQQILDIFLANGYAIKVCAGWHTGYPKIMHDFATSTDLSLQLLKCR